MATSQPERKVGARHGWGKFWTAANMLSMSRLFLVVPIAYLIIADGPLEFIFGLITLAMITDWVDGRVARWSHTVSEWGKVLDPLADKVAASAIVLALWLRGALPGWFLALIVARDVVIVLGGALLARRTHRVVMSLWAGKVAVTSLSITVLAALLRADPPILALCVGVTAALLVYSFARYVLRFAFLWQRAAPAPAPAAAVAPPPAVAAAEPAAAEPSAWAEDAGTAR